MRVINHSRRTGQVTIAPVDDSGHRFNVIELSIDAKETVHFNSGDLERGNPGKGLSGSTGSGDGDWRLGFSSDLDIEVLAYIRTEDGFLTAMHDTVPMENGRYRVAIFNPGSNRNQESSLRLINNGDEVADVTIAAADDMGASPGEVAAVAIPARASRTYTAAQLESGVADGLRGAIGDGAGKWRLAVESEQPIVVMSLLSSPTGHLTNLSTAPDTVSQGIRSVPLFPSASDPATRQGFVRVVNRSASAGEVTIRAFDGTGREHDPLALTIGANETRHFNSNDLELGSPDKGLAGSTGPGSSDWRLALTSELDIEVLAYIRTMDGFLTAMHDLAPAARGRHRIATFNPGSNTDQRSLLRLVNAGTDAADVTIRGVDDRGVSPGGTVRVTVPARSSTSLSSEQLEAGGERFAGALGNGAGKWQLLVDASAPLAAISLLSSPTDHLTNLSSAPGRDHTPPRLLSAGAITMEWGTWRGDVTYDSLGFRYAGDVDADGDDDLVLTSYSPDPASPGAGVILINNGDFSFSVAGGDRPGGVHPGEVLVADFNGDGMNDLFIADIGLDTPPFPGWHNQLLLWTPDGYVDATGRMPADPTGFTHNAAVGDVDGDGDTDILVANAFGEWISGPYFLLNDGEANFVADTDRLPDVMETDYRPWAVDLVDLDRDGHTDLVAGATADDPEGRSFVYWGSDDGAFHDDVATVLPKPGYFADYGQADVITIGVHDCNGDGLDDLLFAGYDTETFTKRGMQLLVNAGARAFFDETRYRLGDSAWSPEEWWHGAHRFFDFNRDGAVDIVPEHYDGGSTEPGANVMAWLNDGRCRYAALRTTQFDDQDALLRFAGGTKVRIGREFKSMYFFGDGAELSSNAAVVVEDAEITPAPAPTPQ